jgi:membrane-associated phospholipid phosphatase
VLNEKTGSRHLELLARLRVAEKVVLGFLAYAVMASLAFPLSLRERVILVVLNLLAAGAILALGRFGQEPRSKFLVALRDWFPAVLILVAYRESGLFLTPDPTHRLDYLFIRWDRVLLESPLLLSVLALLSPWLQRYLELAYLLCYPLVPLGLGALYLARQRKPPEDSGALAALGARPDAVGERRSKMAVPPRRLDSDSRHGSQPTERMLDHFWTSVLLAVLTCYVLFPFFPLTPPRVLFHDVPGPAVDPFLRKMNYWVLNRYSVQACIFPSGHVAAVTAVGLAVRAYLPRLGVLFLFVAASIAVATVYGRYHYAADAVAGALVGVAAFLISRRIHR